MHTGSDLYVFGKYKKRTAKTNSPLMLILSGIYMVHNTVLLVRSRLN